MKEDDNSNGIIWYFDNRVSNIMIDDRKIFVDIDISVIGDMFFLWWF